METSPIIKNSSNNFLTSEIILLAKIISYLFHPLFMTCIIFGFIYFKLPLIISHAYDKVTIPMFFFMTFFSTCFLPYTIIYVHYKAGTINSMMLEDIKQRQKILYYVMFYYFASTFFIINDMSINEPYFLIISVTALTMIICTLFTFKLKVSFHAAGCGGLTGIMLIYYYLYPHNGFLYPFIISIIISGLVISSRLVLKAHTSKECLIGFGIGFLCSFLICFGKEI